MLSSISFPTTVEGILKWFGGG